MGPVAAGTEVGGCLIEELVGRGGMGVVYRARQLELSRAVAIKLIAPERTGDAAARERFLREARAAAAVEHPNVLPVYGAGIEDGQAYFVMRYVAGEDLRTLVRTAGSLPVDRALEIVAALGEALDAIHRAGFVHRDVKPANVLIDQVGNVYLSDFGLAKHVLTTAGLTASDHWVGTLDFAAPEQIRGGTVDARADVYALGCVLHLMLTGAVPFERDSDEAKLWAHLSATPPLVSAVRPGLPTDLDPVVQRALAKDPDDRFPSAGDLARAARAAVEGGSPGPERTVARGPAAPGAAKQEPGLLSGAPTAATRHAGGARRRRWAVIAASLAALIVVATVAIVVASGGGGGGSPPPARASAGAQKPHVGETLRPVGFRPRDIAIANGDLWVISATRPRLSRIDAGTLRRHGLQTRIGEGARSIAAHDGTVWVAIGHNSEVLKLDASSGRVVGRVGLPPQVTPWVIAANASGLWVAGRRFGVNDLLLHYDADGGLLAQHEVPADITALTLGRGHVWAGISGSRVYSFDMQVQHKSRFWLTNAPDALTYGAGYVWASVPADNAVARFDPHTKRVVTTVVAQHPVGLAVAHGNVFVASNTDHRLVQLAPETGKPAGPALHVPDNPWAVAAGEGHVWVTGVGSNTLSRIDY
jgi:predicted Ser/Thr protein kinase